MFTLSKKEFSEELRLVEKVPAASEFRKQSFSDDCYLIAESNPNIYEFIDKMDNLKKIEFEIKIDSQSKNKTWSVNEEFFKNKISKKSILKQVLERIDKRLNKIRKLIYGVFDSNEGDDLSINCFRIEINSSNEILAVLLNHNTIIVYDIFRNGK